MDEHLTVAYLTVAEAANIVRRKPLTVIRWIQAGKIEGFKLEGRYMIDRQSLLSFVKTAIRNNH